MNELERRTELDAVTDHINEAIRGGKLPVKIVSPSKQDGEAKASEIVEEPEIVSMIKSIPWVDGENGLLANCKDAMKSPEPQVRAAGINSLTRLTVELLRMARQAAKGAERRIVKLPPRPRLEGLEAGE